MIKTETVNYYTAHRSAIRTREMNLTEDVGDLITVNAGIWIGQDQTRTSAWNEYSCQQFKTIEDALDFCKNLPSSEYSFDITPSSPVIIKHHIVQTIHEIKEVEYVE